MATPATGTPDHVITGPHVRQLRTFVHAVDVAEPGSAAQRAALVATYGYLRAVLQMPRLLGDED